MLANIIATYDSTRITTCPFKSYSGILAERLLRVILPLDVVRSTWEVKAAL